MRSLKGTAADMARYMGPTASVSNILEKLLVIFGTITSFDELMQNFYKITQESQQFCPTLAKSKSRVHRPRKCSPQSQNLCLALNLSQLQSLGQGSDPRKYKFNELDDEPQQM